MWSARTIFSWFLRDHFTETFGEGDGCMAIGLFIVGIAVVVAFSWGHVLAVLIEESR